MFEYGMEPYPGIPNSEIAKHLSYGNRLPRPDNCPADVYALMQDCWRWAPGERPNFIDVHKRLETALLGSQSKPENAIYGVTAKNK